MVIKQQEKHHQRINLARKRLKNNGLLSDEEFQKKVEKIKNRKEKHAQHLKEKAGKQEEAAAALKKAVREKQAGGAILAWRCSTYQGA